MIKFVEYLKENLAKKPGKNVHLEHLEDEIFNRGYAGFEGAIRAIRGVVEMLSANNPSTHDLTLKWDGCFTGDTKILTNEGVKTLKDVKDGWWAEKTLFVLGRDISSGEDMFVQILDSQASKSDKNWVKIELETGNSICCTEDHEIMTTNRGWVMAKDLTESDDVKTSEIINMDGIRPYLETGEKDAKNEGKSTI